MNKKQKKYVAVAMPGQTDTHVREIDNHEAARLIDVSTTSIRLLEREYEVKGVFISKISGALLLTVIAGEELTPSAFLFD